MHEYTTGEMYNNPETSDFLNYANYVNVCCPLNESSTKVATMNCNQQHHGCCLNAGDLYVCGGKEGIMYNCCEKRIIKIVN